MINPQDCVGICDPSGIGVWAMPMLFIFLMVAIIFIVDKQIRYFYGRIFD